MILVSIAVPFVPQCALGVHELAQEMSTGGKWGDKRADGCDVSSTCAPG